MKKHFSALRLSVFLLAVLFSIPAQATSSFRKVLDTAAAPLTAIHFPTFDNGWAVGQGGAIFVTADQGDAWTAQASGTVNNLNGVFFTSSTSGWAVGDSGTVLRYSSGAWSANSSFPIIADNLKSVYFFDANTGWITSNNSSGNNLYLTTNGGVSWAAYTVEDSTDGSTATYLNEVEFLSATSGWAVGVNNTATPAGKVFRLTNGGAGWESVLASTANETFTSIDFSNSNNGWVVGYAGTNEGIYYTVTNEGQSWSRNEYFRPFGTPDFTGVDMRIHQLRDMEISGTDYWLGDQDYIYQYEKATGNWLTGPLVSGEVYDLFFQSIDSGWAVGGRSAAAGGPNRFIWKYVTEPSELGTLPALFYTGNVTYEVNFSIYGNNIQRNSILTFEAIAGVTPRGYSVVADATNQRYRINTSMEVRSTLEVTERAYTFYVTNPTDGVTGTGLITFEVAPSLLSPQTRQSLPVLVQTGSWNPNTGGKEIAVVTKGQVFSQGIMRPLGLSALAAEADLELIVYRFANRQIAYRKKFRADPDGYTVVTLQKVTDLGLDISEGVYTAVVIHPTQGIIGRGRLAVHYNN